MAFYPYLVCFLGGGYMVEAPHPNVGFHPLIFEDFNFL